MMPRPPEAKRTDPLFPHPALVRSVEQGTDRIEIRLSPAERGRIEVRLELGHDGRVHAAIAVDRADTLDLLQRDARSLERALHDAGLKTDSGGLTFNQIGRAHV